MKRNLSIQYLSRAIPAASAAAVLINSWVVTRVYAQVGVDSFQFENPLVADSIPQLLYALLRIIMVVAVPLVVFFIIYAGFLYVWARGNPEQLQQANRALTYAIIGGLIMIGAMVIVGIVTNLVDAFLTD